MSQLVSRTENDAGITFVYRQDGQTTNTTVKINKTNPPSWTITPSSEDLGLSTWADFVAAMDAAIGL